MAVFHRFVREEAGQDLIEYALLAGFISLAAVAAITTIGTALNTLYTNVRRPGRRRQLTPKWLGTPCISAFPSSLAVTP
ncbi:MAG: hypothetical protein DMF90_12445 [Acidobacteria bacterium]|nr:MAG: hypothetical protein DMF90_12445 [Acidobacteriota bacterium]